MPRAEPVLVLQDLVERHRGAGRPEQRVDEASQRRLRIGPGDRQAQGVAGIFAVGELEDAPEERLLVAEVVVDHSHV